MKKLLFIPLFFIVAATMWYCQKPNETDLDSPLNTVYSVSDRESCDISNAGTNPTCATRIRVRCIKTPPAYPFTCWEVAGSWYKLEEGKAKNFPFTVAGSTLIGELGAQLNVWYNLPNEVIKQSLLDQYCPGRTNKITCVVYVADCYNAVVQWSMLVDIQSGGVITTYSLNGATGILTPVEIAWMPNPLSAFDETDVRLMNNCTNRGVRGCIPGFECVPCGPANPPDPIGTGGG